MRLCEPGREAEQDFFQGQLRSCGDLDARLWALSRPIRKIAPKYLWPARELYVRFDSFRQELRQQLGVFLDQDGPGTADFEFVPEDL